MEKHDKIECLSVKYIIYEFLKVSSGRPTIIQDFKQNLKDLDK